MRVVERIGSMRVKRGLALCFTSGLLVLARACGTSAPLAPEHDDFVVSGKQPIHEWPGAGGFPVPFGEHQL